MLGNRLLLGIVIGILLYHYYSKKKGGSLLVSRSKVKSNIQNWLKSEGVVSGREYDPSKLADNIIDGNIVNAKTNNVSGEGFSVSQRTELV